MRQQHLPVAVVGLSRGTHEQVRGRIRINLRPSSSSLLHTPVKPSINAISTVYSTYIRILLTSRVIHSPATATPIANKYSCYIYVNLLLHPQ